MLYGYEEIDLHDLKVVEALEFFVKFYNSRIKNNNDNPFKVIHGYGSKGHGGKIKNKLRKYLDKNLDKLDYEPGEKINGNQGETIIYPFQPLFSLLEEKILDFCISPKSKKKIVNKFFKKHGDPRVMNAIQSLSRQGKLVKITKGSRVLWETKNFNK